MLYISIFSCLSLSSGTLYSRPKTASVFPSPVGRIEADNRGGAGRAVLYSKDMVDAVQFFRVSESWAVHQDRRIWAHVTVTVSCRVTVYTGKNSCLTSDALSPKSSLLDLPDVTVSNLPLYFPQALDTYLKQQRVRFTELFREFDRDRSGHLDSHELRSMIQALMPNVTEAQLR